MWAHGTGRCGSLHVDGCVGHVSVGASMGAESVELGGEEEAVGAEPDGVHWQVAAEDAKESIALSFQVSCLIVGAKDCPMVYT